MALFLQQDGERTELQKRIAQELADKAKKKSLQIDSDQPDGVEDSAYLEQTKKTTSLAWVWIVIIIIAVALMIWVVVATR